jgi:hypothetical protein
VTVDDNASDSPQSISLSGRGYEQGGQKAAVSTTSLDFGVHAVDQSSSPEIVVLTNSGSADLSVGDVYIAGDGSHSFSIYDDIHDSTLHPGVSGTISVIFTPATEGEHSASLVITDDTSTSPQIVALTGTGAYPGGIYFIPNEETVNAGETLYIKWFITDVTDIVNVFFGAIRPNGVIFTLDHHRKWKKGAHPIVKNVPVRKNKSGQLRVRIPPRTPAGDYQLGAALRDKGGMVSPGIVKVPITVQ